MGDEFGTVNMKRGERTREIEVIRQQYQRHRETLTGMLADAPTEYLATEYQRLIVELDASLAKLNELEARPGGLAAAGAAAGRATSGIDTQPMRSDPGKRRLVATPPAHYDTTVVGEPSRGNKALLFAILIAGLAVLAILGWLMWRSPEDEVPASQPVVTQPTSTVEPDETTTISPAPPMTADARTGLALQPQTHDFGVIRKGTRAVRQYELTNATNEPVTITVARSDCRCLYYSHAPVVPPKGKETITVTIDGARARPGPLRESVKVSAKNEPSLATTLNVNATVR